MSERAVTSSRKQFDHWAHTYDRGFNTWYFDQTIKAVLCQLPGEEFRLLDVGCGTGRLLSKASHDFPLARLSGIDLSPNMIERARYQPYRTVPELLVCSADHLPYHDAAFEFVVCSHSLHHHPDPCASLREMHRVLVPGGMVLLTDGVLDSLLHRAYFALVNLAQREWYVHRLPSDILRQLFLQTGFEVVGQKIIMGFNMLFVLRKK